jgi:hypothetical protein
MGREKRRVRTRPDSWLWLMDGWVHQKLPNEESSKERYLSLSLSGLWTTVVYSYDDNGATVQYLFFLSEMGGERLMVDGR